jgi:TonB family protein
MIIPSILKNILITLAVLLQTFYAWGQCNQSITVVEQQNSELYFSFLRQIPMADDKGRTTILTFGVTHDKSIALIFVADQADMCVERGDTITFNFVDGRQLHVLNDMDPNCDEKFAIFFGGEYGKREVLDTLKAKLIAKVTLHHKGNRVAGSFLPEKAKAFSSALRCLDEALTSESLAKELTDAQQNRIFMIVEQQPEYEGGYGAMLNFIEKNLKRLKVEGTVHVSFVIDKEGNVTEPKVIKSLSPEADSEALRVVSMMPRWKPGRQQGKPVLVRFNLPFRFK